MMILNDDSSVVNKFGASLTDDARVIIYDCHMFRKQATGIHTTCYELLMINLMLQRRLKQLFCTYQWAQLARLLHYNGSARLDRYKHSSLSGPFMSYKRVKCCENGVLSVALSSLFNFNSQNMLANLRQNWDLD
jgi:hypothetical protein